MMEGEERETIHEEGTPPEDDLEGSIVDGHGLDTTAQQREEEEEEKEDGPFPSLEVFLHLLKKNMSKRKTNRLTPEELNELNRVRRRLTEDQWNSFLAKAREARRKEKLLTKEQRDHQLILEEEIVRKHRKRMMEEWETRKKERQTHLASSSILSSTRTPTTYEAAHTPKTTASMRTTDSQPRREYHTYDHSVESTPSGRTPASMGGDTSTDRSFPSHIQPEGEEFASPSRSREDSIMIQNLRRQLRDTEIRLQMSETKLIEERDASTKKIQTLQRTVDSQENQIHQMSMSYEKDVRLIEQELESARRELEEERKLAAEPFDKSDMEHRRSINRSLPTDVQEAQERILDLESRLAALLDSRASMKSAQSIEEERLKAIVKSLEDSLNDARTKWKAAESEAEVLREDTERLQREHMVEIRKLRQALEREELHSPMKTKGVSPSDLEEEVESLRHENMQLRKTIESETELGNSSGISKAMQILQAENSRLKQMLITAEKKKYESGDIDRFRASLHSQLSAVMFRTRELRAGVSTLRDDVYKDLESCMADWSSFRVEVSRSWSDLVHSSELAFEKEVDEQMYMSKSHKDVETSSRQMTEMELESSQMSRSGTSPAHSPGGSSSGSVHWKSNPVRCYARIRPLPSRQASCVSVEDEVTITIKKGRNMRSATLDGVYPPESTQGELAEDIIDLAQCLLDGRNVCLISYGESRSGKTYTLHGSSLDPGLISRLVLELYNLLDAVSDTHSWNVRVQAVEFKGDRHMELLTPADSRGGVKVETPAEFERQRVVALGKRMKGRDWKKAKDAHLHDPHASFIFYLSLEMTDRRSLVTTNSFLSFVDMAASNTSSPRGAVGDPEAAKRKKANSSVGEVLIALGKQSSHIPYRNSRFTLFLQKFLQGNPIVLLYVHVIPLEDNYQETLRSILFVTRIKSYIVGREGLLGMSSSRVSTSSPDTGEGDEYEDYGGEEDDHEERDSERYSEPKKASHVHQHSSSKPYGRHPAPTPHGDREGSPRVTIDLSKDVQELARRSHMS
eukprot:TRINITY_DN293_c0_g6_i1.p1 TRINITY_DN293_c0_g6~~TRINITY_DN293_c0_g6_i1.p1  ORF type:complete len:1028 (+),score=335.96 TRINITY_DN293_c0_g6_i1:116-3199(+)